MPLLIRLYWLKVKEMDLVRSWKPKQYEGLLAFFLKVKKVCVIALPHLLLLPTPLSNSSICSLISMKLYGKVGILIRVISDSSWVGDTWKQAAKWGCKISVLIGSKIMGRHQPSSHKTSRLTQERGHRTRFPNSDIHRTIFLWGFYIQIQ